MRPSSRFPILGALLISALAFFASCQTSRKVATPPYHVAAAPMGAVGRTLSNPRSPTTTTTTIMTTVPGTAPTAELDLTTPGHPIASPSPSRPSPARGKAAPRKTRAARANARGTASAPQPALAAIEYPIAKAVRGKPGFVFSPFDTKGRYIDVRGWTSGSKVKDPWTNKIFIVP